jgi:hypothetical protein
VRRGKRKAWHGQVSPCPWPICEESYLRRRVWIGSGVEELLRKRGTVDLEMDGDIANDARECADAEVRVIGNRYVMLAALLRW